MPLNYTAVGATDVEEPRWTIRPRGFRAYERSVRVGSGDAAWQAARSAVMAWGVKTRSGFTVRAEDGEGSVARVGADYTLIAKLGPWRVREPAREVAAVDRSDRCGFAYGTRVRHPVSGEEAFIVTRDSDGTVRLTLRSLTRASPGRWRLLFPLILVAQRWYRFRYLRSLRGV